MGLQPGVRQGQTLVQAPIPAQVGGRVQGGLAVALGRVGPEDLHGLPEAPGPGGHPGQHRLGLCRQLWMDLPVALQVADGLIETLHPAERPATLQEGVGLVLPELQHPGVHGHGLGEAPL